MAVWRVDVRVVCRGEGLGDDGFEVELGFGGRLCGVSKRA